MTDNTMNERDIFATNAMIRNMRAGTFRKAATGVGVVLAGAALTIWACKQGVDPEVLKETLRSMPPLTITVKIDPDSKVLLVNNKPVTEKPETPLIPDVITNPNNNKIESLSTGPHEPAAKPEPVIQTSVTVFKTVKYKTGSIMSGWTFPNGAATRPDHQYCYFTQNMTDGSEKRQDIARNGKMIESAPSGVFDQSERMTYCQWFS